jgi:hypothetical protein
MYGEETRIKGRHEDGYRQMVSRDEQDEGANEMDATLPDKTDNSLQASHFTPAKRWMTRFLNGATGCIIIKFTF